MINQDFLEFFKFEQVFMFGLTRNQVGRVLAVLC